MEQDFALSKIYKIKSLRSIGLHRFQMQILLTCIVEHENETKSKTVLQFKTVIFTN